MLIEQDHDVIGAALATSLQSMLEEYVALLDLAGLAIGVVKDEKLVYAQGFGVRNRDTGEAVTPHSLFHLASVSKPFVATAVMQLVEQDKIALDAPVVTYLPYFKMDDARAAEITVEQMLTHTSGMPDVADYLWYLPEYDEGALERYVRSLKSMKLLFVPGEKYAYSNAAFEVLGDLIAKVSGESFESYVKRHILTPLGMHASTFLRQEVAPELATTPHFGAPLTTLPGAYPYHRAHAPSSTLHSNIIEMSQWAIANLNRGEWQSTRILQPESHDLLWQRRVETGEKTWGEAVGLSWFHGNYQGQPVVHHGGSDPGFNSDLVLLPDRRAAVILMANSNTAQLGKVMDITLDLLLGEEVQLPKLPVTIPIGATLANEGIDAALAHYRRLEANEADAYDFNGGFFGASWGAIEMHRAEHVLPLLQLWLTVHPDDALAHEMMGWTQMIAGEREQAAVMLRRAVELDKESRHAALLLSLLEEG